MSTTIRTITLGGRRGGKTLEVVERARQGRPHYCAIKGCRRGEIPYAHAFCDWHWDRLPRELAQKVWHSYGPADSQGRPKFTRQYRAAVEAARDYLLGLEVDKPLPSGQHSGGEAA